MKFFVLLVLFMSGTAAAETFERCPALGGEYIPNACPRSETAFTTTMIHLVECKAIGFQRINYRTDGTPQTWGPVAWEPVGLGKILRSETDRIATYVERFYDSDSLYTYIFDQDKTNQEFTYKGAEIIDLLPSGNLFVTYPSSGMTQTMINRKNCGTTP